MKRMGMLNVNAIPGIDVRNYLQGIDEDQLLRALESLKVTGIDNDGDHTGGFVLILVLFILLVIIGAGFGPGDEVRGDENQVPLADAQDGGFVPQLQLQ